MKISVKCNYALRAMFDLALNNGRQSLSINDIARNQKIPKRYLEHILLSLKRQGLVESLRGKAGGYRLAKQPRDIKVSEIIEAIEGVINIIPEGAVKAQKDVVSELWTSIQNAMTGVLGSITLEELAAKKKHAEKTLVYYI